MTAQPAEQWEVVKSGRDYHVLPIGDTEPHTESVDCACNPRCDVVGGGLVVVHHAYDFREVIEELRSGELLQ